MFRLNVIFKRRIMFIPQKKLLMFWIDAAAFRTDHINNYLIVILLLYTLCDVKPQLTCTSYTQWV